MYPKYYQIRQSLEEKILTNEFKPDDRIPSEIELSQSYDASRITVRKAISELVKDGLLYTIQGKGTYVSNGSEDIDMVSLTSCTQDIIDLGYKPNRKVISSGILDPTENLKNDLKLIDSDKIFNLSRVYYADDESINFTSTNLPIKYFEGLDEIDFKKHSLYYILETKYGVNPENTRRSIQAVIAPDYVYDLLKIEKGIPLLLFECVTYAHVKGMFKPIESYTTWYRSDKFKFYINQKR